MILRKSFWMAKKYLCPLAQNCNLNMAPSLKASLFSTLFISQVLCTNVSISKNAAATSESVFVYDILIGTATSNSSVRKAFRNNYGILPLEDNNRYTFAFTLSDKIVMDNMFKVSVESISKSPLSSFKEDINIKTKFLYLAWGSWNPTPLKTLNEKPKFQVYFNLFTIDIKEKYKNLFLLSSSSDNKNMDIRTDIYSIMSSSNNSELIIKDPSSVGVFSCDINSVNSPDIFKNIFNIGNTKITHEGIGEFKIFILAKSEERNKINEAIKLAESKGVLLKSHNIKYGDTKCIDNGVEFKHGEFQRLILV